MVSRPQNSIPRMLWSVYRPPFSETLRHRLLSSQSVATSVFARRGCLLPILATRCEKLSRTVSDRERHTPSAHPSTPTQLRVKPTTSITSNIGANPTAYISTITTTVNATTANTKHNTYTPTTTAVNVTTDTTFRNVKARTAESTHATTIVSIVHTTKDKGDEMEDTEGEKARGERTRENRGERTEERGPRVQEGRALWLRMMTTSGRTAQATNPEQQMATGTATPSPSRSTRSQPGRSATCQLSVRATKTPLQFAPRVICLRSRQVHEIHGAAFNAAIVVFNPMSHANPPARDCP